MRNSERGSGEDSPSKKGKKPEEEKKKRKKEKPKLPTETKERRKNSAEEMVEKLFGGIAKEAKGVREEFRDLKTEAASLRVAFELLDDQIRNKNIKSFEELERVMNRIAQRLDENFDQLEKRKEVLLKFLDKELEQREDVEKKLHEHAEELGKMVETTVSAYEQIHKTVQLSQEHGILPPSGERPPDWEASTPEERREFVNEQLKMLLVVDTPFAENWRRAYALEMFLAKRPEEKELRKEWQKYSEKFDRMRVEHACFLGYNAASSAEALQNVTGVLSLSKIEAGLKDKKVVEELMEFQKDAERIVKLRGEKEEQEAEGEDTKDLEREISAWIIRMKRRLAGKELIINKRTLKPVIDEEPMFDEDRGLAKIEAGRLFVLMGMASGYDITELTGGDFFRARVEHLYNRIAFRTKKEGGRWWRRGGLVDWMRREIGEDEKDIDEKTGKPRRITGLEVFTHKFGGGFLASVFKKEQLEKLGLRQHREWIGDRFINVVKIEDKDKLTKVNFEKIGITRENQLSADVLDATRVADEVRAALVGHQGYLDLPTFENYLKFGELFKHLRGTPDKTGFGGQKPTGGSERDRLMVLIHKDWLEFYKGPGKATRFFTEIFTLGILPRFERFKDYRFIRPMKVIDPETGEEKILGYSLGDSDGELLRLGKSLNSVSTHGSIDDAVKKGCYSPQYAEGLLRDQIKLLKIIPGIGPIRVTQEVLDKIGVGGFVGGILFFIFAPILEFARQAAKQMEQR